MARDVVTADGSLRTASAAENQDLFWGVRGSSGNLGIVTSLEYRLHKVGPVFGGAVFYPVNRAKDVLHFCRDFNANIPDELVIQGGALTLPDAGPVFAVAGCYCGPVGEGEKSLAPLRKFGSPIADIFASLSYVQMQGLFFAIRLTYVKSSFIRELSDAAIETLAAFAGQSPSPFSFAPFFEHWHGAATRVPVSETAFPHQKYSYNPVCHPSRIKSDPCINANKQQLINEVSELIMLLV